MKNKYIGVAVALVVLVGAGGLLWFIKAESKGSEPAGAELTATSTSQDASAIVASWGGGGAAITRGQLDAQIQELAKNPQIQIPDASEAEARAEFERLVLDQMINGAVFFNEAERQGFTVDDAAIDRELEAVTTQYENVAAFEAALMEAKLDKDALRENIRHQLITKQYYEKIVADNDVTVSEEEIRAFYDEQVVPQDATAVFEDVEDQIKAQLEQQKVQGALSAILEELRTSAGVQVLI